MNTNGVVLLKCCYGPDGAVRRIQVPSSDFDVARDVLASTYGKAIHTFTLQYDDDEGERCSVTCQVEWDEARAISASAGKLLKLFMTDVKPATATATATATCTTLTEQHVEDKHQHKQERQQQREQERQEKREAKEAHKLAKQAQHDEERAQKQAHQAHKQQRKEEKQAEKQHHKHMKHLQKQINQLQTGTQVDSALDPSSPVLTHVIAPLDDLLALLSDPVFVMVSQQVVTVGLQSLLDSQSATQALDAMAAALSNSPLGSQAPVSSLLAHFRPILQRLDDKLQQKRSFHLHLRTRLTSRHVQVVQQCLQHTHLVPNSIPVIIDTLTDLRQRVVSTGDMEPVVKALTALMKHTAVATGCQRLHIDTHKLLRKIIKHVFGHTHHGHHGHGHHGHGMGWGRLWGHHGRHGHDGHHGGHHAHGHRHGWGTWGGWGHSTPAPTPAPVAIPVPMPAPVAPSPWSTLVEVEPGTAPAPAPAPAPANSLQLVHPSIACDGCNMSPIHGVRYKCTVCEDCDLCEACEAQGLHPPQHTLIKIKTPHTGTGTGTGTGSGTQPHKTSEWGGASHPPFGPPHVFGPPPPFFGPPPFPFPFPHPYGAPPPPAFHHGPHGHPPPPPPPPVADSFWGPRGHGHSARHWRSESDVSDMSDAADMSNVSGPGSAAASASASPPAPRAYLVRHSNYPDRSVVGPDTVFVKTWVLHNSGDAAWPATTRLMFKRGARELLTGPGVEFAVPLAAPGTDVDVSAPLRTPSLPGRYTTYFRLVDTATQHPFGPKVWCDVHVASPAEPTETHGTDTGTHTVEQAAHPSSSVSPLAYAPLLARESVYPIQMNALIGMGFTDSTLNESVLAQHGGNLQQTANHLLELLTKDKIGSQHN